MIKLRLIFRANDGKHITQLIDVPHITFAAPAFLTLHSGSDDPAVMAEKIDNLPTLIGGEWVAEMLTK